MSIISFIRPIKGICGLTPEAVVGLVANLESRELRRVEYKQRGLPFEHPRASATDDVEGIIATMHEMVGEAFDVKQFTDEQPKILNEFNKRIDPDLSFFTGLEQMNVSENLSCHHSISHLERASLKDLTELSYHVEVTQVYLFRTEHPCHRQGS